MSVERIPIESREQWLALRKQDITASVCGALFAAHPYRTLAGLYAEKTGLDLPGPDPESAAIRRGRALETIVGEQVGLRRPEWDIAKADEYLRDPALKLGCTPDFWIHGDPRGLGVLQAKTVGAYKFKKEWLGDGDEPTPPLWIILQNTVEVMLADAAFGAIGVLAIGDFVFDAHVVDLDRNRKAEHRIRVAVRSFWQALDAGQAPAIDPAKDGELLAFLYPREREGSIVDLTGDNRAAWLCEERARQGAVVKEAEAAKTAAEVELKNKIGDHEAALINGWRCTLRTAHRPEKLHAATHYRVLRTSPLKDTGM